MPVQTIDHPRTTICGVRFSCFDRNRAATWLCERASGGGGYVCVTGAHGVVIAQEDLYFRAILNAAAMNTLDGQPVAWIARWRGFPVERVTGRELVWDVIARDRECKIMHVFFGAVAAVTDGMLAALRSANPGIRAVAFNPPFAPMSDAALDEFCQNLQLSGPTIVWVGLSTPKQEHLATRLSHRLPGTPVVAIGAGFDFVAGIKMQAPKIVTLLCLEWMFRLALEPRRLLSRYINTVPKFALLLVREFARPTARNRKFLS